MIAQVVEHPAGAGVVEVDQAGQVRAVEQHVVAEQVGMQVGARQRWTLGIQRGDLRQGRGEQGAGLFR